MTFHISMKQKLGYLGNKRTYFKKYKHHFCFCFLILSNKRQLFCNVFETNGWKGMKPQCMSRNQHCLASVVHFFVIESNRKRATCNLQSNHI